MKFLAELKKRNSLLYWFGLFNLAVAVLCLILMQTDNDQVLGVNRFLKPFKFYVSVGIMVLTMGWLLHYDSNKKAVRRSTLVIAVSMLFENALILLQAFRNTTSHYNISSGTNTLIFNVMGIFILIFTVACIRICIRFFRQKEFSIPMPYVWGIRLGILFFIIFSLEAGLMLSQMQHTVGAADGGPGLPLTNWSKEHGDLRIAHFLGIHSLQVLPLLGHYIARSNRQLFIFSFLYISLVIALIIQALAGIPLFF